MVTVNKKCLKFHSGTETSFVVHCASQSHISPVYSPTRLVPSSYVHSSSADYTEPCRPLVTARPSQPFQQGHSRTDQRMGQRTPSFTLLLQTSVPILLICLSPISLFLYLSIQQMNCLSTIKAV